MFSRNYFYCYSLRLYHFLFVFNEKCITSSINPNSKKRYWVFIKSDRLDKIIRLYNDVKHKF